MNEDCWAGVSYSVEEGETLRQDQDVELWYPDCDENRVSVQSITVGLVDVRMSADLKIKYDFGRDGWAIYQETVFEWDQFDNDMDRGWREVAFIQAFQEGTMPY